jgi:hypothetical protein
MSFNGSGTFVINSAGQPVVANTVISATTFNALTADLANGLTTCITKDGQTTPTANIPMGGFKITNLANGTAATDAATVAQIQSNGAALVTVTGVDTLLGSLSPALTTYVTGAVYYFIAPATNTGAVTLNIDTLGAKNVTRDGTTALVAGDIVSGEMVAVVYDGTRFQLISPVNSFTNLNVSGTLTVAGNSTLNGNLQVGNAGADTVNFQASGWTLTNNVSVTGTWADIGTITTADINGGTIDGTTIGGGTPAAGTFTTATATTGNITTVNATTVDSTNLEVTNLKAKDGTNAGSIADSTGVVTLNSLNATTVNIDGGTIDATTIGGASPAAGTFSNLTATNLSAASANLGVAVIGTFSATTLELTNLEVTNIKADDGTPAMTVQNVTGKVEIGVASIASANAAVALITTGTVTNLVSQDASIGSAAIVNAAVASLTATSASIASMNADVALLTTATVTTLTATGASIASANIGNLQFTAASIASINAGVAVVTNLTATSASIASMNGSVASITTVNATTVDATNVEVTNVKALDGTAAITIADSTGVVSFTANPTFSAGTANGVLYLNGSKEATSGSALTFDGTNLGLGVVSTTWSNGASIKLKSNGAGVSSLGQIDSNIFSNAYYDSGWKYFTSAKASVFENGSGSFLFKATPSAGTANNAITFTTLMELYSEPSATYIDLSTDGLTDSASIWTTHSSTSSDLSFRTKVSGTAATRLQIDTSGVVNVSSGATINGGAVFNETGADVDFRIESDTNANAFFLDGATGSIGIGGTPFGGRKLDIAGTLPESSGFTIPYSLRGTIPSTTANAYGYYSNPTTEAASFTITTLNHFFANPSPFGAGSTVSNQYGFHAGNTLTGATNNYGVYSNIASGSGRYNFFANGSADNYFAGNTGIGTTTFVGGIRLTVLGGGTQLSPGTTAQEGLRIQRATGYATLTGINNDNNAYNGLQLFTGASAAVTVDTSGNVGIGTASPLSILQVGDGTDAIAMTGTAPLLAVKGASFSTGLIVRRDGFAEAGIQSSGTGNFGTWTSHDVVFTTNGFERMRIDTSGNVGIGGTALSYTKVDVSGTYPTGSATSVAFNARGTVPSGTTNDYLGVWVSGGTAGAAFTLARAQGFLYSGTSAGAGSTITNQYGFHANASVTAATNNYGFYSAIASAANRWNLYCAGTAENYVANNLKIGGTAARATTAGTNQLVLFDGTAPVGTLANGVSFYSASGEANVMDAAGNATLLSPHDSETNEWIFRSKHTPTGKVLKIDVEKMLRFINEHFDLDMVQEWTE